MEVLLHLFSHTVHCHFVIALVSPFHYSITVYTLALNVTLTECDIDSLPVCCVDRKPGQYTWPTQRTHLCPEVE